MSLEEYVEKCGGINAAARTMQDDSGYGMPGSQISRKLKSKTGKVTVVLDEDGSPVEMVEEKVLWIKSLNQ